MQRGIFDHDSLLHEEIMEALGNFWFKLLPSLADHLRAKFWKLVSRIKKAGPLVKSFECALELSRVDLKSTTLRNPKAAGRNPICMFKYKV